MTTQHITWALRKAGQGDYRSLIAAGQRAKAALATKDRVTTWRQEIDRMIDKMPLSDGQKWLAKISASVAEEQWKSNRLDNTLNRLPISEAKKTRPRLAPGTRFPWRMACGASSERGSGDGG